MMSERGIEGIDGSKFDADRLIHQRAGRSVYYGVIDGNDLNRLYQAYRSRFK